MIPLTRRKAAFELSSILRTLPLRTKRRTSTIRSYLSSPPQTLPHRIFFKTLNRLVPLQFNRARSLARMAPPKLETVSVSIEDTIGIVKYNRPKNANSISPAVFQDLLKAFKWVTSEPNVKVVVYTGEGKFFCAGLDLMTIPKDGPVLSDESIEALGQIHKIIIDSTKVMIAAVNGPAVGYGMTSIALCDMIYSVPDATFFTPFAKLAIAAEACSSISFTRIMGRQKAAALILGGERMAAQELESVGFITKILPKESFTEEVMKIARRIAAQPSGGLEFNKKLMMAPIREEMLAANERECQALRERCRTSEPIEALRAFEKEQQDRKKSAKL